MKRLSFQLLLLFSFIPNQIWAQPQEHVTPSFPKVDNEPLSAVPDNAFRINDLNITTEEEKVYLNFSACLPEDKASRIITFPVKLTIDEKLVRYVSVAAKCGTNMSARVTLSELTPGRHHIQLGDLSRMIDYGSGQ